jgi:hypothetical protein
LVGLEGESEIKVGNIKYGSGLKPPLAEWIPCCKGFHRQVE